MQSELKQNVALAALEHVLPLLREDVILGIGTGSTVDCFIDLLAAHGQAFAGAVSSSERSTLRLRAAGIAIHDLNDVARMPVYVDGADEIDHELNMIKGGGGALTREKIVAASADSFLCIADESKLVDRLGGFPLPVEIIPMARRLVTRHLERLGGRPLLRSGFLTDNGCEILDVAGLDIPSPAALEAEITAIPGVVACGLFAVDPADMALVAGRGGVVRLGSADVIKPS